VGNTTTVGCNGSETSEQQAVHSSGLPAGYITTLSVFSRSVRTYCFKPHLFGIKGIKLWLFVIITARTNKNFGEFAHGILIRPNETFMNLKICSNQWRTEGGVLGGFKPPLPKIPNISVESSIG